MTGKEEINADAEKFKASKRKDMARKMQRQHDRAISMRTDMEGASPVLKSVIRNNQKSFKHDRAFAKGRLEK